LHAWLCSKPVATEVCLRDNTGFSHSGIQHLGFPSVPCPCGAAARRDVHHMPRVALWQA